MTPLIVLGYAVTEGCAPLWTVHMLVLGAYVAGLYVAKKS